MQLRIALVGICMFMGMLISQHAFAKEECPPGYISYVNTETYQSVCLKADSEQTQTPDAADAQKPADAQPSGDAAKADDAQSKDASDEQSQDTVAGAPQNVTQVAPVDVTPKAYTAEGIRNPQDAQPAPVPLTTQISDWVSRNSSEEKEETSFQTLTMHDGWLLQIGFGYGMIANVDFKLLTGYAFYTGDDVAAFGLYLDADLRPGWLPQFSADISLDPTLHVHYKSFRFSLGIGLGIFLIKLFDDDTVLFDKTLNEVRVRFILKPTLAFDWFMNENAYFGFGVSMPLIFLTEEGDTSGDDSIVQPWVNLDLHIGYKF